MDNIKVIDTVCPFCDKEAEVRMPKEAFDKYEAGALIQDAWPEGSTDDRERLISGICPECWNKVVDL